MGDKEKEPLIKDVEFVGQIGPDGKDRKTVKSGKKKDGAVVMRALPKRKKKDGK